MMPGDIVRYSTPWRSRRYRKPAVTFLRKRCRAKHPRKLLTGAVTTGERFIPGGIYKQTLADGYTTHTRCL